MRIFKRIKLNESKIEFIPKICVFFSANAFNLWKIFSIQFQETKNNVLTSHGKENLGNIYSESTLTQVWVTFCRIVTFQHEIMEVW